MVESQEDTYFKESFPTSFTKLPNLAELDLYKRKTIMDKILSSRWLKTNEVLSIL
jgi:hypothetical protein